MINALDIPMINAALLEIPILTPTIKGKKPLHQPAVIADKAANFHLNQNSTSQSTVANVSKKTNRENQNLPFQDHQQDTMTMLKTPLTPNPDN